MVSSSAGCKGAGIGELGSCTRSGVQRRARLQLARARKLFGAAEAADFESGPKVLARGQGSRPAQRATADGDGCHAAAAYSDASSCLGPVTTFYAEHGFCGLGPDGEADASAGVMPGGSPRHVAGRSAEYERWGRARYIFAKRQWECAAWMRSGPSS